MPVRQQWWIFLLARAAELGETRIIHRCQESNLLVFSLYNLGQHWKNMGQGDLAGGIKVSGEIKSKAAYRSSWFLKSCLSSPLQKSKGAELSAERRDWGWIVQSLLELRLCLSCQDSSEPPLSWRRLLCSSTGDPQCGKRCCRKEVLRCRSGQNSLLFL